MVDKLVFGTLQNKIPHRILKAYPCFIVLLDKYLLLTNIPSLSSISSGPMLIFLARPLNKLSNEVGINSNMFESNS